MMGGVLQKLDNDTPAEQEAAEQERDADIYEDAPKLSILRMDGSVVGELPHFKKVADLKDEIHRLTGMATNCQELLAAGSPLDDDSQLENMETIELLLMFNDRPTWTWDLEKNPAREMLQVAKDNGSDLTCPDLRRDYINVWTQESLSVGCHYFQFVMHSIGDEQWCGLVEAGFNRDNAGGRSLEAWTYYCGRMGKRFGISSSDGSAGLHANGWVVHDFETPKPSGDVIGMLVDFDAAAVVFDLNGQFQGGCQLPRVAMKIMTHMDKPQDRVELRKLDFTDAPLRSREALSMPLPKEGDGTSLRRF
eukprot:TRINITY_DN24161_c0_g1_i1.p1 TRINITY_DN24161_c0_g1~~TRINITY_DN24161_c0_g1_i1.p1  ORF type:complete len:306 (-),score=55.95 TRINITY_DN24161_c0_g1_i1:123-1040(-)